MRCAWALGLSLAPTPCRPQLAYLALRNQALPAELVTASPCATAFPGLGVAVLGSSDAITVTVSGQHGLGT